MADRPLCWTCKHGLCMKLKRGEVLTGEIVDEPGEEWKGEESQKILKTEVRKHDYLTYCWWHAAGDRPEPSEYPLEVLDVEECSRYKEKSSDA